VPNDDGRRGYVQAWDVKTGTKLWETTLFKVRIDPSLEEDVQWVFVKRAGLVENRLLIVDERNRDYSLDLKTGRVLGSALEKELPAKPPGGFFPVGVQEHEKAASFKRGEPVVGTTYFCWYDIESKAHIINGDGTDAMTTHPADMDGISYKSAAWHKRQLGDMIDAGVDFLMPVYWGVPGKYDGWSFVGLPPLVEAHSALEKDGRKPPAIGMFYDTSILQWNGYNADGSNYHVDLSTDFGRQWFYTAIRDFWSLIPPAKWARVDGRPIIFLYEAAFVKQQDPERQFAYVKQRFREDFGVEPFLVKSSGWKGEADTTYSWGGAVSGPIIFKDVIALGPGYDHSAVPGRRPLIVDRKDGGTYIDRWTKVLQLDPKMRPWMVHVETWNEWHEGTDIADSREHGRAYIVLTRLFSEMWHSGTHLRFPSSYVNADRVSWEPGKAAGVDLSPSGGDGYWQLRTFDGVEAAVSAANPHSPTSRYLYFNVDDAFAYGLLGTPVVLSVTYRDAGCSAFAVEYDSTINEGPLEGAFRPAGSTKIEGTEQWKTADFKLSEPRFMNRANGADLRLAATGGNMELAVRRLELRKVE
jgi:hypothetical protein